MGAYQLADAINDKSRRFRPSSFNACVLWASGDDSADLDQPLCAINEYCPLAVFIECARHAKSFAALDLDKRQLPSGTEQSIEWTVIDDNRALLALKNKYHDETLAAVDQECKSLINNIDSALAECEQLKSQRDTRLSITKFSQSNTGLNIVNITASSAATLADKVKGLGDENTHWAFCIFVGSSEELAPIQAVFA